MGTANIISVNFKITNLLDYVIVIFNAPKRLIKAEMHIFSSSTCVNLTLQIGKHNVKVTAQQTNELVCFDHGKSNMLLLYCLINNSLLNDKSE